MMDECVNVIGGMPIVFNATSEVWPVLVREGQCSRWLFDKVLIEFDGPAHYLRPAMGSRDRVGPIDARTRIRNALLKKSGDFEVLVTIPYYEWKEVEGRKEKEEEHVKMKVGEVEKR